MKVQELYKATTDRIIAELEQGVPPWAKPWKDSHVSGIGMLPSNLVTGRLYSGGNVLLLWLDGQTRDYPSLQYCTFKQANEIGAKVRKGEKSCTVLFTKRAIKKDEATGEETPTTVVKTYSVFHLSQLDGVPDKYLHTQQPLDLEPPNRKFRDFVNGTGVEVRFGFNQACYEPKENVVKMPAFGLFDTEEAFAGTLNHELFHATGHKDRLNRTFGKKYGDPAYCFEEICAELGASFLNARMGYQPTFRSAAYIKNWLKLLRQDNQAIFRAASYAGQGADWLWKKSFGDADAAPEQEEEKQLDAAE